MNGRHMVESKRSTVIIFGVNHSVRMGIIHKVMDDRNCYEHDFILPNIAFI